MYGKKRKKTTIDLASVKFYVTLLYSKDSEQ